MGDGGEWGIVVYIGYSGTWWSCVSGIVEHRAVHIWYSGGWLFVYRGTVGDGGGGR